MWVWLDKLVWIQQQCIHSKLVSVAATVSIVVIPCRLLGAFQKFNITIFQQSWASWWKWRLDELLLYRLSGSFTCGFCVTLPNIHSSCEYNLVPAVSVLSLRLSLLHMGARRSVYRLHAVWAPVTLSGLLLLCLGSCFSAWGYIYTPWTVFW